jgi:ferredoxin-thioredoxin reductase catalytic subunit
MYSSSVKEITTNKRKYYVFELSLTQRSNYAQTDTPCSRVLTRTNTWRMCLCMVISFTEPEHEYMETWRTCLCMVFFTEPELEYMETI